MVEPTARISPMRLSLGAAFGQFFVVVLCLYRRSRNVVCYGCLGNGDADIEQANNHIVVGPGRGSYGWKVRLKES